MPELPEVETTRRGLLPLLHGRRIRQLEVRDPRLRWPVPGELPAAIRDATISGIERRAKYLLMHTDKASLLLHLGMSGSLRVCTPDTALRQHDHLIFRLDDARELRFHDPRRFGCCLLLDDARSHALLANLGPEPLDSGFSAGYLFQQSRKRRTPLKAFIMEQRTVVGVGNIYATEALFRAGLRPGRATYRVTRAEFERLYHAIREVLAEAIDSGGTTLRDFVREDGSHGYFGQQLRVYGREGEACSVCGHSIRERRIGGRASAYCPNCQT
jgi:formamidopyrimidine-DNA glycosylase